MNIDPSKPVGWLSITSMLAGGILAKILVDNFLPEPLYMGATVLFFVVLFSIFGLVTGRIIEILVHDDHDKAELEIASTPSSELYSCHNKMHELSISSEKTGQQAEGCYQHETNSRILLGVLFTVVMAIAVVVGLLTGNFG